MATMPKLRTLEEFLALPEEKPALEFQDGVVTKKVSPKGRHSALQFEIAEIFNRFARPLRLARAFPELRTTFAGASRVPDVALYRWERVPLDAAGGIADDFLAPPDLVVEIASPNQRANALLRRCRWYVDHGVGVALLVDPDDASILVFRPGKAPRMLRESDRVDLDDILPGFNLVARELFAALRMG